MVRQFTNPLTAACPCSFFLLFSSLLLARRPPKMPARVPKEGKKENNSFSLSVDIWDIFDMISVVNNVNFCPTLFGSGRTEEEHQLMLVNCS